MESISIAEIKQKIGKINLIDIRSITSFNNNHIPSAKNIPQDKLLANPEKYLNKAEIYYIYCQKGKSSINIGMILQQQGYQIINVEGGYERWILMN